MNFKDIIDKFGSIKQLRGADLRGADLRGADLHRADLGRADLSGADLSGASLHQANLHEANPHKANLRGADLRGADLYGADLYRADLYRADLSGTDLRGANLNGAELNGAELNGANLRGANLSGANLSGARNIPSIVAAGTLIVPQEGSVYGWKKCRHGVLVKLYIPWHAKRHNATGRKCRAEYAIVVEVIGADKGVSMYDPKVTYQKGQKVVPQTYDPDRWNECAGGIHFFLTREEAEEFAL